jgi:hypothetical protein
MKLAKKININANLSQKIDRAASLSVRGIEGIRVKLRRNLLIFNKITYE